MIDIITLNQSKQQILNIIEALQLYKDTMIKPKYKHIIDDQLENIGKQLKNQNIDVYINKSDVKFSIGEKVIYENANAIIISNSDENEFVKVVINQNNKLEIIDVPIILLDKIKE